MHRSPVAFTITEEVMIWKGSVLFLAARTIVFTICVLLGRTVPAPNTTSMLFRIVGTLLNLKLASLERIWNQDSSVKIVMLNPYLYSRTQHIHT